MDANVIMETVSTLGFPIVAVLGCAWFIFKIYTDTTAESKKNMVQVQKRCQEREDKLYNFLEKSQKINAEFAMIIQKHEDKLDEIKKDVNEIKNDITIIMVKQEA